MPYDPDDNPWGPYGPCSPSYGLDGPTYTQVANEQAATNALVNAVSGPASVSGDAGTVTQHPIPSLIQANNYLAGIVAAQTRRLGVRYTKLRPDGTAHVRWRWPRYGDGPNW